LHGQEETVFADAGYTGVDKRPRCDVDGKRAGFVGSDGGPARTERGHGEEHQAADLQVAQVGAVAEPDVGTGGNADQGGDRDVDVGKSMAR
jgi:hypothetical protein